MRRWAGRSSAACYWLLPPRSCLSQSSIAGFAGRRRSTWTARLPWRPGKRRPILKIVRGRDMDTSVTNISKAPERLSKSGSAWRLLIAGLLVVVALGAFFAGRLARQKTTDQLNAAAERSEEHT